MAKNKHKGSSIESFFEDEGILDDIEAVAIKRIIAYQLKKYMEKSDIKKSDLAERLGTSRSALDRLLDPRNTSVTLNTLLKAAHVVGKKLKFSLE